MALYPDFAPDAAYGPRPVDQKGRAFDAHVFTPVHALLDPGAIFLADLAVDIGGENERQAVLFLELVVRGDRILGDADNDSARATVIRERIAKPAGLCGAARGVVLRVEIQNDFFAAELGEAHTALAVGRQGEIGGFSAELYTHNAFSPSRSALSRAARFDGVSINSSYHLRTCAAVAA